MYRFILISRALFGAQEIYYTQNNHNELHLMETLIIFPRAQRHHSNNTKSEVFANPTFFRDALYVKSHTHRKNYGT